MSWVAVAVAGAAVIGGAVQADSAKNAANQQNQAANRANAMSERQYQQQREDAEPWRQAGMGALTRLNNGMDGFQKDFSMGDYQADPGYQFRMDEGMKAIQGSAAAKGSLNSGATLKALTRYGQGVASEEYGNAYNRFNTNQTNRFNRLATVAGIGQTANGQVSQAGQNYANQFGQNTMGAGNANAAASIAQGNAINGAASQGMNTWMQYQMMNQARPQGGYGSAGGGTGFSNIA